MSEKIVEVTMGSRKVGRIALDRDGRAMFEYDAEWIRNGFSVKELRKVFRLMTFNLIIGNCDDHVKNFAFIRRDDVWQLAPAYDVLPCEGLGGFHSLSVNGNYKNPGKTDAVQLAVKFGLPKDEAEAVFEEIRKRAV